MEISNPVMMQMLTQFLVTQFVLIMLVRGGFVTGPPLGAGTFPVRECCLCLLQAWNLSVECKILLLLTMSIHSEWDLGRRIRGIIFCPEDCSDMGRSRVISNQVLSSPFLPVLPGGSLRQYCFSGDTLVVEAR